MTVARPVPRVSIVITTCDRAALVAEAIESVLRLEGPFELEPIVVDDGSSDDTPGVLERYPVRVLRTDGIGMARARTLGLEAATGDFFGLLDDDDVFLPAAVSTQLAEFDAHPEYAAVHAQAQMVGPDLDLFGEPFPGGPLSSGDIFVDLLGYFPQVGTILTRMESARAAGAFDPDLPGDNDWDWLLRVARVAPIGTVEVPVLLFRQRVEAHEELTWKRLPATKEIFLKHTASLPLRERARVRPVLWRHYGWAAGIFLNHAQTNWRAGDRRRAARSMVYALRSSPPHLVVEVGRRLLSATGRT